MFTRRELLKSAAYTSLVVSATGLTIPARAAEKILFAAPQFVETEAMAELGKKIAAKYGYEFEPVWFPFDSIREKLILDHRSGATNWDIVYVDSKWVSEFARLGLTTPIEDLLGKGSLTNEDLNLADIIDIHLQRQQYEGKTWSLPILAAYVAMAYRNSLFEHEGERAAFKQRYNYELQVPDTYDQYYDVAEFFTRRAGETLAGEVLKSDFYGVVYSNRRGGFLWHKFLNVLQAFGGDIIYDPKTMQPTWNSPETIAAATYYKKLLAFQPADNINMTSGEATSLFASGASATHVDFLNRLQSVVEDKSSAIAGQVGYALPPTQDPSRPHAFIVNTNGVGVYANGAKNAVSAKILAEILSASGQTEMTLSTPGYLPTRASVWGDNSVTGKYPEIAKYVDLVTRTKPYTFQHPQIPEYPRIEEIATASIHEILSGSSSVEDALNAAQQQIERIFKSAGYIN